MQSSLENIKLKIQGLIEDFLKNEEEAFFYINSNVFLLSESNINSIKFVSKNDIELTSGEYDYNENTNKIEIIETSGNELNSTDVIKVGYDYYKYSDTELEGYIRSAIVWISVFSGTSRDFEIENSEIYPTPDNRTADLIALVAGILINPDYTSYKLNNVTVTYFQKLPKEQKIEKIVTKFNYSSGVMDIIEFE